MDTVTEAGMAIAMAVSAAPAGRAWPAALTRRVPAAAVTGTAGMEMPCEAQACPLRGLLNAPDTPPRGEAVPHDYPRHPLRRRPGEPSLRAGSPLLPGGGLGGPAVRARWPDPPNEGPGAGWWWGLQQLTAAFVLPADGGNWVHPPQLHPGVPGQ